MLEALALSGDSSRTRYAAQFSDVGSEANPGGRIFDINVVVDDNIGGRATRHAVFEVDPRDLRGYVLREWDLGSGDIHIDATALATSKDCLNLLH